VLRLGRAVAACWIFALCLFREARKLRALPFGLQGFPVSLSSNSPSPRTGVAPHTPDSGVHFDAAQRAASKKVVLLTVFLDILGFGIVIPQLGIYAAQFGASPNTIGWLASIYSLATFLFAPFWGKMSDRVGRRPILIYSIFGTGLSYFLFAVAGSIPMLFASRLLAGVTGANIGVAQAYLSDVTEPDERFKTFGIFGAIFGIGFAIGPLIGTLLSHLPGAWGGNFGVGIITGTLSIINVLLALKVLPEPLSPAVRASNGARHREEGSLFQIIDVSAFRRAFSVRGLNLILTIGFVSVVAFATLQGTFTLYIIRKYTRPEVQAMILRDPQAAINKAKDRLAQSQSKGAGASASTSMAGEGAAVSTSHGENEPYSKSMGGDFAPDGGLVKGVAAPAGMTWREIEKALVQPRASEMVGLLFTTIGLVSLVVQGGFINPLKKRFGDTALVVAGVGLLMVGIALVPLPHVFWGQFPVSALIAVGNGISAPVLTALVSLLSPEAQRGETIGVFQSMQSLGRIIGPITGGYLFEHGAVTAPYWTGAAVMAVAFVLSLKLSRLCAQNPDFCAAQSESAEGKDARFSRAASNTSSPDAPEKTPDPLAATE
jgi:MFS family permease